MLSEEVKTSGEDRRLVAQHLESPDQLLRPFHQRNGVQQLVNPVLRKSAKQSHPAPEALLELNLSAHCGFRDLHDLVGYAGQFCQLIDDFALNQCGIHIESKQAAVAPEDALALEGDIDFQIMSGSKKRRAHGLFRRGISAHRQFDAGICIGAVHCERQASGETLDPVHVQTMLGDNGAYPGKMVCRNRPAKDGHDKLIFALRRNPLIQVSLRDGGELDLQPQLFRPGHQGVLNNSETLTSRNFDQQPKRERFMDNRLSNIEHTGVKTGQDCGQLCSKARPVPAGEVNQDGLVH